MLKSFKMNISTTYGAATAIFYPDGLGYILLFIEKTTDQ